MEEYRRSVSHLAVEINLPQLPELIQRFLYDQLYPDGHFSLSDMSLHACPNFSGQISVFHSASVTYHVQDDIGIHCEHICSTPSWYKGPPRYDCAYVNARPHLEGMHSLDVVRIFLFFSFAFEGTTYPCALVHWFRLIGDEPDEDTGMWIVEPESSDDSPTISVIHLDCILRAAHLIPIYGPNPIPRNIFYYNSLDAFRAFHVDKFIDYHAFNIAK